MSEQIQTGDKFTSEYNRLAKTPDRITAERVLQIVSEHSGISINTLKGASRPRRVSLARHCFSYLLRKEFRTPVKEIGFLIGQDHTSICYGADIFKQRILHTSGGKKHRELLGKCRAAMLAEGLI